MLVLVSYDVSTINKAGQRRLTRIAKTCLNYAANASRILSSSALLILRNGRLCALNCCGSINPKRIPCASTFWVKTGKTVLNTMAAKKRPIWKAEPSSFNRANPQFT